MVNEFPPIDFLQIPKFGLEVVLLERRVSKSHADAAFGESCRMYMNISQQVTHRRIDIPITLQFYDDQLVCTMVAISLKIMERDVEVYGQTLGLLLIHQRHAVKPVANHRIEPVKIKPRLTLHQFLAPSVCRKFS